MTTPHLNHHISFELEGKKCDLATQHFFPQFMTPHFFSKEVWCEFFGGECGVDMPHLSPIHTGNNVRKYTTLRHFMYSTNVNVIMLCKMCKSYIFVYCIGPVQWLKFFRSRRSYFWDWLQIKNNSDNAIVSVFSNVY